MRTETLLMAALLILSACGHRTENNKHAEAGKNRHDSLNIRDSVNTILNIPDSDTSGITDSVGGSSKVEKSEKKASPGVIELSQGCKVVLNSTIDTADSLTSEILNGISDIMLKIQKLLPADSITIDLEKSKNVIPGFGVGGQAFIDNKTWLRFDPENPSLTVYHFNQILAHEIHHVVRLRMRHKETSPLELMILEGLADHFMVEVLACEPPPWSQALTEEEIQKYFFQIKPILNVKLKWGEESDRWFDQWFLGRSVEEINKSRTEFSVPTWSVYPEEEHIPLWTGYSLGWRIVDNYLKAHPKAGASNLVHTPANVIVVSTPELLN